MPVTADKLTGAATVDNVRPLPDFDHIQQTWAQGAHLDISCEGEGELGQMTALLPRLNLAA